MSWLLLSKWVAQCVAFLQGCLECMTQTCLFLDTPDRYFTLSFSLSLPLPASLSQLGHSGGFKVVRVLGSPCTLFSSWWVESEMQVVDAGHVSRTRSASDVDALLLPDLWSRIFKNCPAEKMTLKVLYNTETFVVLLCIGVRCYESSLEHSQEVWTQIGTDYEAHCMLICINCSVPQWFCHFNWHHLEAPASFSILYR